MKFKCLSTNLKQPSHVNNVEVSITDFVSKFGFFGFVGCHSTAKSTVFPQVAPQTGGHELQMGERLARTRAVVGRVESVVF